MSDNEAAVCGLVLPATVLNALVARVKRELSEEAARPAGEAGEWIRGAKGAAAHMGCSPQRVYDLVNQARLKHSKDGSALVFRRTDLDNYLKGDDIA